MARQGESPDDFEARLRDLEQRIAELRAETRRPEPDAELGAHGYIDSLEEGFAQARGYISQMKTANDPKRLRADAERSLGDLDASLARARADLAARRKR